MKKDLSNRSITFQSPQWGSNSKEACEVFNLGGKMGFSPRNGEVILKTTNCSFKMGGRKFQSPQWGSNSKEEYGKLMRTADGVSVPAMGK